MKKLVTLIAVALGVVGATAGTAAAAGGWTSSSVPSTGNNVTLLAGSARANNDAWAVGQQFVAAGQPQAPAAAFHWNGMAWSQTPTPNLGQYGALRAVSSSSLNDAWAVGFTIIRKFDYGTLIEHWNGSSWSATSVDAFTGAGAGLTGVVDLSSTNAWAVGATSTGALLEHWNGAAWTTVAFPDPNFSPSSEGAISADSATDIWVVGSSFDPTTDASVAETLHYNGATWTVVPVAQPGSSSLAGITALSPTNVWAVGGGAAGTLTEHYNGIAWQVVPSPNPGADAALIGVAGRSAGDVYAVGNNIPSANGGPLEALILRWNGSSWSVDSDGAFGGALFAAATFPGAANEWAVGFGSGNQGLALSHG
ncbi:MAG: hypothetical protein ACLP0J_09135 [Solirubrobacteraceae bacterium]